MPARPSLVVTSIAAPNGVLRSLAAGAARAGWDFVVIGDTKSPAGFALDGCEYYNVEQQQRLPLRYAQACPTRHYCRKNIGYLLAAGRGASCIVETDDDNFPREEFFLPRTREHVAGAVAHAGWVNVYGYFVDGPASPSAPAPIWPRGLPLDQIRKALPAPSAPASALAPIQQGLADENPDVDAVYRLTMPLPVRFARRAPLVLRDGAWCPFNSQNTTFFPEAYALAYLPATCSFRMTDIWRSFVAQRVCWANAWGVLFHEATVWQERNEHSLMRDFADEVPGYLHNAAIAETLAAQTLAPGVAAIPDNLRICYDVMVRKGWIELAELDLLNAYLADIAQVGAQVGAMAEPKPARTGVAP